MAQETKKQKMLLTAMSLIAALGGFLFGYDTGIISGALLFIRKEFDTTTLQESLIVSIVAFGALFGALSGGRLSDAFGRKKIVLSASVLFIISALCLSLAPSPNWIITGRFVVGLAIGSASATGPLYIAEIAPRSFRGTLVSLNQLAITLGILISYLVGYLLAFSGGWRVMFALAAIPSALQLAIMSFFPETPRWLTLQGKKEQALAILARFRGNHLDAEREIAHIEKTRALHTQTSWSAIFHSRAKIALLAGVGITIIQQITGINTIIYFAPTIFQFAGFNQAGSALLATTLVGALNVLMTCVALYLLDKVGRKPLLLYGLGGMVLCLLVLGFGFLFPESEALGWITLAAMLGYIASFAVGLGPIAWLLNAEIYPLRIRGRANGIATCANWLFNFLVTFSFLEFIALFGKTTTFWLYAVIGLFGIWFILTFVPETKGKSLEEIEDSLGS